MAYTTNTHSYLGGGLVEGAWKEWAYITTDSIQTVLGSGYISDAAVATGGQLGAAAARRDLGTMNIAPVRDTFGALSPEYVERETIRAYQRDSRWVTAPNEDGLGLVYDHLPVRNRDGTPVFLTWAQLGARAADMRRAEAEPMVWGSPTLPERARGQRAQRDFRRALHDEPFRPAESEAGPVPTSDPAKAPSPAPEGAP